MKSDFLIAITQLSAEKNLPKETVIGAVESALVSAYKKNDFAPNQNIRVKINPNTGGVKIWAEKTVVDVPSDHRCEIALDEARRVKTNVNVGDVVEVECTPRNAGRIAAQTAKQVILQRLHEAEHSAIFEEYANKEGDTVTGIVQRIESRQVFVDLGRTEAMLPATEQMPNERYRIGQRLKVYLLEVARTNRGSRVVVSRSHPDLLRRLFELEVPEVFNGLVEIKALAREASSRSKIAVTARQEGIDPVGCCVGLRGIRIQNVVNELNGEKIDVVAWNPEPSIFIANAISPAQVVGVNLNDTGRTATVIIPDKQLSLAIGKEGQNVRLAAKLTGWHIDIKSASTAEVDRLAEIKSALKAEKVAVETTVIEGKVLSEEVATEEETVLVSAEALPIESSPVVEAFVPPAIVFEPPAEKEKHELRFAEDISASVSSKVVAKSKKKKKGTQERGAEDGVKQKKRRRSVDFIDEEEY